jgi:transposase InsO family protein
MKTVCQPDTEPRPQSKSEQEKRLLDAGARLAEAARFTLSGLSAEEYLKTVLADRGSLKPKPNTLRLWAHVYTRTPTVEAFLAESLRWEEAVLRHSAIAPITRGEPRFMPDLSAEARAQQLRSEHHPLQYGVKQLYALRSAYLKDGCTVQALLDGQRGGKGGYRGWLASPDHQQIVRACERDLIAKNREPYPDATLLRVRLQRQIGSAHRDEIPDAKTLDRFRRLEPKGISPGERTALAKGDRAFDVAFSPKMPTSFSTRHGEIITYDHTPADVSVRWGEREIRPTITDCIDPTSGACRGIVVSPYDAGSAEIALVIRDAIRRKPTSEDPHQVLCGLPIGVYSDRGKDMLSAHIRGALHDLGIEDGHGQGYRPYSRGSIEGNLHKCIHKICEPELPGYVGSKPKERPPDVKAVLTFDDYAAYLRHWVFTTFNTMKYQRRRLDGQRASRIELAVANHAPIEMPSKDALMFGLMKRKPVTIEDTGVRYGELFVYFPPNERDMALFQELIQQRARCELRYEPSDMAVTYLFREGRLLMELFDARAFKAQATERDSKWFETLRARGRKEMRERTEPIREAAQSRMAFLDQLEEERAAADEEPEAAVAAGGGEVRRILPIDHARRRLASSRIAAGNAKIRRPSTDDWNPWVKR